MSNPKLSFIIVSWNTSEVTHQCLLSIENATWRDEYEIIVVDNNSSDDSVEMIRTKHPQVRLIANADNKLFAKANNQGAKIARGEYLFLLNSDTLIWGDNVQRMVEHFDTLPRDVISIGPRVLNADKTLQSTGYPNPGLRERFLMCTKLYRLFPIPEFILWGLPQDKSRQVGWNAGCSMMMRSKLYAEVGGLNERLEFYGEEAEFGYRTYKKFGYKTYYWNGSEIIHLGGVSTKKSKKPFNLRDETPLRRYAKIQRETVGFTRAIWMSRVVLRLLYVKWLVSGNKPYFADAITYEKRVIAYLKRCRKDPGIIEG